MINNEMMRIINSNPEMMAVVNSYMENDMRKLKKYVIKFGTGSLIEVIMMNYMMWRLIVL